MSHKLIYNSYHTQHIQPPFLLCSTQQYIKKHPQRTSVWSDDLMSKKLTITKRFCPYVYAILTDIYIYICSDIEHSLFLSIANYIINILILDNS